MLRGVAEIAKRRANRLAAFFWCVESLATSRFR
jgi:hypothetical protein